MYSTTSSRRDIRLKILRTDYFSTFKSNDVDQLLRELNIEKQESSPYRHHQNAAEREIQTLIGNVSAVTHGTELLRADTWERAAAHWVQLHNDLPNPHLGTSPNAIVTPGDYVDAKWQYRFAFGDLVCFYIDKDHRTWKFDTRNEVGFYVGDKSGMKGGVLVYRPYRHDIMVRDDVHHINVSDVQLLTVVRPKRRGTTSGTPIPSSPRCMAHTLTI
jgi:hypothetical protein